MAIQAATEATIDGMRNEYRPVAATAQGSPPFPRQDLRAFASGRGLFSPMKLGGWVGWHLWDAVPTAHAAPTAVVRGPSPATASSIFFCISSLAGVDPSSFHRQRSPSGLE